MSALYDIGLDKESLKTFKASQQELLLPQMMAPTLRAVMQNELTKRQRECVYLVYFEQLSQHQAAKLLGLSQPTVRRHVQLGLKKMHTILTYCTDIAEQTKNYYNAI